MRYYVFDHENRSYIHFQNQEDLVLWWRRKARGFEDLNVTGKDIGVVHWMQPAWNGCFIEKSETWLRRYQVFDKEMRSVDIRQWSRTVWDYEAPHVPYRWASNSRKQHWHRITGPSFWHGTLKGAVVGKDEDVPLFPIKDKSKVRNKVREEFVWDYIDRKAARRPSRSWKDQSKARKQWGKSKPHSKQAVLDSEPGDAMAERLMKELGISAA